MLYLIYQQLDPHEHYVPVANLLRYLTFRTGAALFTAQLICVMMGSRFSNWLRI